MTRYSKHQALLVLGATAVAQSKRGIRPRQSRSHRLHSGPEIGNDGLHAVPPQGIIEKELDPPHLAVGAHGVDGENFVLVLNREIART